MEWDWLGQVVWPVPCSAQCPHGPASTSTGAPYANTPTPPPSPRNPAGEKKNLPIIPAPSKHRPIRLSFTDAFFFISFFDKMNFVIAAKQF